MITGIHIALNSCHIYFVLSPAAYYSMLIPQIEYQPCSRAHFFALLMLCAWNLGGAFVDSISAMNTSSFLGIIHESTYSRKGNELISCKWYKNIPQKTGAMVWFTQLDSVWKINSNRNVTRKKARLDMWLCLKGFYNRNNFASSASQAIYTL